MTLEFKGNFQINGNMVKPGGVATAPPPPSSTSITAGVFGTPGGDIVGYGGGNTIPPIGSLSGDSVAPNGYNYEGVLDAQFSSMPHEFLLTLFDPTTLLPTVQQSDLVSVTINGVTLLSGDAYTFSNSGGQVEWYWVASVGLVIGQTYPVSFVWA